MSNRGLPRRPIEAATVVLALVIVWALLVPGADWLVRHNLGSANR
jgi:hypothetical protein